MGSTNFTPNYNLSQFIGTDKPAWLQDYNGDMLKIDTGINAAKTAADSAANAASAAQGDATTALGGVSSLNTTVGTLSNTVGTAVGNINTINSLIGNGTPTTTDQTIIGAINEINSKFTYKQATGISIYGDGVKTRAELMIDLVTAINNYVDADHSILLKNLKISGSGCTTCPSGSFGTSKVAFDTHVSTGNFIGGNIEKIESVRIGSSNSNSHWYSFDLTDQSLSDKASDVLTSSEYVRMSFDVFEHVE